MAMHFAVSTLSPVSIQNLIPPWHKDSIVPYISSYSLSSTPVTPSKSKFYSKNSSDLFIS